MVKYRVLNNEELQHFEKEFVNYLVVNGIEATEWEKIKKEDKEKSHRIIELFSDVVFESILRKVQFIDHRSSQSLKSFQCLSDKIILVSIDINDKNVNLLNLKDYNNIINSSNLNIEIYTTEKKYNKNREEEIFEMINSGCEISDGSLFKTISLALAK